jgi:hypothetical protein
MWRFVLMTQQKSTSISKNEAGHVDGLFLDREDCILIMNSIYRILAPAHSAVNINDTGTLLCLNKVEKFADMINKNVLVVDKNDNNSIP